MPVEIKELIIRTNIISDLPGKAIDNNGKISEKEKREIVDACINRIVKIMAKKNER